MLRLRTLKLRSTYCHLSNDAFQFLLDRASVQQFPLIHCSWIVAKIEAGKKKERKKRIIRGKESKAKREGTLCSLLWFLKVAASMLSVHWPAERLSVCVHLVSRQSTRSTISMAAPLSASRWTTPQPASCSCTSLLHVFLHLTATLAPPLSYGTRKKSRHNLSANPPTKSSFLCNIPLCYCTLCFCKQTCVFLSPFSLSASD